MEIHLTPQTEQKLKEIAAKTGREAETYYRRKIAAEHDASFRAAIQEALDDPRPLVPHAEVTAHFAKLRSDALSKVE